MIHFKMIVERIQHITGMNKTRVAREVFDISCNNLNNKIRRNSIDIHPIAAWAMDEGVNIDMELLITSGRGWVPAEGHDSSLYSEGFIPVDSFFSPVHRVNYKVTSARVKNSFNYDKLTFDIDTDGSLSSRDALAYAAMILREHTKFFINFSDFTCF